MLRYAIDSISGNYVHIDNISNGEKHSFICPGCNDNLIVNSQGSIQRSHFTHDKKFETQICQITQINFVVKEYFSNIKKYKIPDVILHYDDQTLTKKGITVTIHEVQLEYEIDKYTANILLKTDIGIILIEFFLTHPCLSDKANYYKANKITSIEYNLSLFKNKNIEEVIQAFKADSVEYRWLFPWFHDELVEFYCKNQKKKKKAFQDEQKKVGKALIDEWKANNCIPLLLGPAKRSTSSGKQAAPIPEMRNQNNCQEESV